MPRLNAGGGGADFTLPDKKEEEEEKQDDSGGGGGSSGGGPLNLPGPNRGVPTPDTSSGDPTPSPPEDDDSNSSDDSGSGGMVRQKAKEQLEKKDQGSTEIDAGKTSSDELNEARDQLTKGGGSSSSETSSSAGRGERDTSIEYEPDESDSDNANQSGITGLPDDATDDPLGIPDDPLGVEAWRESETGQELRQDVQNIEGDGLGARLKAFNIAAKAGSDFVLDNPRGSAQDRLRGNLEALTGSEDLGESAKAVDDTVGDTAYNLTEGTAAEGTAVETGTNWTVKAADMFFAEPAKQGFTLATGVDPDTGSTEGNVGAAGIADVALTLGTAGAGKAGLAALRGSDEAATAASRLLGGSDEAASTAASGADDASLASRLLGDGSKRADDPLKPFDSGKGYTTLADLSGDSTRADSIFARFADDGTTGPASTAASGADEAAETAAGAADDGSITSRLFSRFGDDAAAKGDEAGSKLDDVASTGTKASDETGIVGRLTSKGKYGAVGAGAIFGAGVVSDAWKNGGGDGGGSGDGSGDGNGSGTTWNEPEPAETHNGCQIYRQGSEGGQTRYLTVTEVDGEAVAVGSNGSTSKFGSNTRIEDLPTHSSLSAARSACDELKGGGGGGGEKTGDWGELQAVETLSAGWSLARQDHTTEDNSRWFLLRTQDGDLQAINSAGKVENVQEETALAEMPHFDAEADAREAFGKWSESNDGGDESGESDEWSDWRQLREVSPWWVFARQHKTEEKAQFLAAGEIDGNSVYLGSDGSVQADPYIFEKTAQLKKALQAYFKSVKNGDVPEDRQPNGGAPSTTAVGRDVKKKKGGKGGSGPLSNVKSFVSDNPLKVAAIGGAAAVVATQGGSING